MSKITYTSLKLKTKDSVETFDFNNNKIEVLQYLPIEEKYDIVMSVLENSKESDGLYNPLKIDMYFHLYLVYAYTNITFTEKQRENESKLYDTLQSNEFISNMINKIPEEEYQGLYSYVEDCIEDRLHYSTTTAAALRSIIGDLPKQLEQMQKVVDNFDPNKYQAVIDFAKAANGNREI